MKKQIDLTRPKERRAFTHQPIPVSPVIPEKKESPSPVLEAPVPNESAPAPQQTSSFSFITVVLIAIIVIMVGFIYYIFFLSV